MEKRQLDLSAYRLEKARDEMETAALMLANNKISQSINRSYYSMFHAVRALLALDQFDSKKHTGIISYFNQYYIKTKKIEPEFASMLTAAFKIRNESDYNDFYIASRDDAYLQLENAKKFLIKIDEYIKALLKKQKPSE